MIYTNIDAYNKAVKEHKIEQEKIKKQIIEHKEQIKKLENELYNGDCPMYDSGVRNCDPFTLDDVDDDYDYGEN